MPKLQAITFDFWNTLYTESVETMRQRGRLRAERVCEGLAGRQTDCPAETAAAAIEEVWAEHDRLWREHHRTMGLEEVGRMLAAKLGRRLPVAECVRIAEAVSDAVIDCPPTLDPNAVELLERLAAVYRLAIISDTGLGMGRSLRMVLENDGVLRYFGHQTFSNEVGTAKPGAEAFADACGRLGVEPRHTLHVGDNERSDIAGAKAYGMWAVRIDRNGTPAGTVGDAVVRSLAELPEVIERIEGQSP